MNLAALLLPAASLLGQEPLPLEKGDRVRVLAPALAPSPLVGTVLHVGAERFHFELEGGYLSFAVAYDSIFSLEVSEGLAPRRADILRGAGVGLLVGILPTGIVLAAARCFGGAGDLPDACSGDLKLLAAAVVTATTAAGGVIGALTRSERWRRLPLPSPVATRSAGLGLEVRLRR